MHFCLGPTIISCLRSSRFFVGRPRAVKLVLSARVHTAVSLGPAPSSFPPSPPCLVRVCPPPRVRRLRLGPRALVRFVAARPLAGCRPAHFTRERPTNRRATRHCEWRHEPTTGREARRDGRAVCVDQAHDSTELTSVSSLPLLLCSPPPDGIQCEHRACEARSRQNDCTRHACCQHRRGG